MFKVKGLVSGLRFSLCCLSAACFLIIVPSLALGASNANTITWEKVDGLDAGSLSKFIKLNPDSKHVPDAKLFLGFQEKMTAYKAGKMSPAYIIPFSALGDRWKSWLKRNPNKGSLGLFVKKQGNGASMGMFKVVPGKFIVSFDSHGTPAAPTGDGSLIAFKTDGLKFEWVNGLTFQTQDVIYFGVVKRHGLVYLHGKGTVILTKGKVVKLPIK